MKTRRQRLARFNTFVTEGRIVRSVWRETVDGRKMACLLGAFGTDINAPRDCPVEIMPQWLADLTSAFQISCSNEIWPALIDRYAAAANAWHVLGDEAWGRCLLRTLRAELEIAKPHDASGSCDQVIELIDRELSGDAPAKDEWRSASARSDMPVAAMGAAKMVFDAAREAVRVANVGKAEAWDAIADACLSAIEQEIEASASASIRE